MQIWHLVEAKKRLMSLMPPRHVASSRMVYLEFRGTGDNWGKHRSIHESAIGTKMLINK